MNRSRLAVGPDGVMVPFHKRPLIAILDDEPAFRELMADIFMNFGWDSIAYEHKDEFLLHLPLLRPDVIITDVISPRMGGLQFLKAIKADRKFQNIPVIIASACSWAAGQEPARAFAIIAKPWECTRMVRTVRRALREKRGAFGSR
jgi:DNA-binding NtrC family response regulator